MAAPRFSTLTDSFTLEDSLDFEPYVVTLSGLLAETKTPLTLGVFGDWGSGKTSLLRMVQKRLEKDHAHCRTVWFDAWKYDQQETLWRALLLQVLRALRKAVDEGTLDQAQMAKDRTQLDDLESSLYRVVEREEVGKVQIDAGKLLAGVGQGIVQVALSFLPPAKAIADLVKGLSGKAEEGAAEDLLAAIRRERTQIHVDQVQFLEQFQDRFAELVHRYVVARGEGIGRLVVFVDDLDRCLPEKAVEVLEAIKFFLDVPGCAFALGLAPEVIARGIEMKYREFGGASGEAGTSFPIDGQRYLEKIIQVPFTIPEIEAGDMQAFVSGLVETWPHPDCAQVFAVGLGGSPRRVKRAVNVFLLLWRLAKARSEKLGESIKPIRLAKIVVLQQAASALYEVVRETPRLLRELEDYYLADEARRGEFAVGGDGGKEVPGEGETVGPPPGLAGLVANKAARALLLLHPPGTPYANFAELTPEELKPYFTLTRSAEAPVTSAEDSQREFVEPELVTVPGGKFLMGSTEAQFEILAKHDVGDKKGAKAFFRLELPQHEVELQEYRIGKHPVTNLEYQRFVRETKHRAPEGWEDDAYPKGKGDHPVVGVDWQDAIAFSDWLTEKTGKRRTYRLPSEAEWEKAARGTDGRIYPWGNDWDSKKVNSGTGGLGDTTPVGQYSPAGDSPFEAADMAGNVWEWTRSEKRPYPYLASDGREDPGDSPSRVVRGGAFRYVPELVRCAVRFWFEPALRLDDIGFRVVASPFRSGF